MRGRSTWWISGKRIWQRSLCFKQDLIYRRESTPRIDVLLTIALAVCDWGLGLTAQARLLLEGLYLNTKVSKLYHHFVLQALVKIFGNAETQVAVSTGLSYARELVEFTTSVKKAKFYRQLQSRKKVHALKGDLDAKTSSFLNTAIDAIAVSKEVVERDASRWSVRQRSRVPT